MTPPSLPETPVRMESDVPGRADLSPVRRFDDPRTARWGHTRPTRAVPRPALTSRSAFKVALGSTVLALGLAATASAQEALRQSLAGEAAAASRRRQQENQPYSLKSGDLKLLIEPSLSADWLDDIYLSDKDKESDVIISPMLRLNATYPLTDVNALNVSVAVGYDFYADHDEWNVFRLEPGSELSFDFFIKDLRINLHERFSYVQDPAQEAAVANAVRYGGFYNAVGITGIGDLKDVVLTLGYDHSTFVATTSDYEYLDRGAELPLGRIGYKVNAAVTAGVEATGSFNRYDDPVLNNSTGYSAGAYADWQVTEYLQVRPRAGYASYFFDQTSAVLLAEDQDAWYADLTLQHRVNEAVSYSLSAGHELRLGINSDTIEAYYVRPSINWRIVKDVSLTTYASYENGKQPGGLVEEDYDHFGAGFSVGYQLMEKMRTSLNYRWTLRSSDAAGRDYSQNRVGLHLAYRF